MDRSNNVHLYYRLKIDYQICKSIKKNVLSVHLNWLFQTLPGSVKTSGRQVLNKIKLHLQVGWTRIYIIIHSISWYFSFCNEESFLFATCFYLQVCISSCNILIPVYIEVCVSQHFMHCCVSGMPLDQVSVSLQFQSILVRFSVDYIKQENKNSMS